MAMHRLLRHKPYLHLLYTTATTSPTPCRQSQPLVTDPILTLYFLQKSYKHSPAITAASPSPSASYRNPANSHRPPPPLSRKSISNPPKMPTLSSPSSKIASSPTSAFFAASYPPRPTSSPLFAIIHPSSSLIYGSLSQSKPSFYSTPAFCWTTSSS
ncbi:hypothetical protein KSP39_PZI007259 [Platanthera zijinensis]|uniref:Uncharacterized protein n=1 Tax=Platanthera zijinensis TaxID=2320716 RepID=A0AAP0BPN8_9ASPA